MKEVSLRHHRLRIVCVAVAVASVAAVGCGEASHEPRPFRGVQLLGVAPEAPLPANSSMFIFVATGDEFMPEDVRCEVAGIGGEHTVHDLVPSRSTANILRELSVLGAPAWGSPDTPAPTRELVLLWTPARNLPVGQASVQFGKRLVDGEWHWKPARRALEPEGGTTVVDVDLSPPETPTVELGRLGRAGRLERLNSTATSAVLRIVAEEPLRWDLLRVSAPDSSVRTGPVVMMTMHGDLGRGVNRPRRPYMGFVAVAGDLRRDRPQRVLLENLVDLSGNRVATARVPVSSHGAE